ncbi:hypothetical protein [Bacillus shivajii]|nr:hypothetical protein [Bacillus shivajii]
MKHMIVTSFIIVIVAMLTVGFYLVPIQEGENVEVTKQEVICYPS